MDTNLVDRQTEKILHETFHLASLYPYQNLVIRSILERGGLYGKTARTAAEPTQLVVLPTGSGKSVCFMLPALLLEGLTVVVYPLLSLMNDQMRRMEHLGCRAVMLRGGQTAVERQAVWKQLEEGTSRFVISNAETLSHPPVCERLARLRVSLLVIDEAHTVTQWGESFRPAYLGLHAISRQLNPSQVVAFTATASPRIIERVTKILFGGERPHMVYGNPDRPNIRYRVLPSLVKMHDLQMLVTCAYSRPMLIFCSSRARCEHVAWELYFRTGVSDVRYYHAGLARDERERTESWFFHSTSGILVSTSAYGMGVDKRDIRTVIHLDIPADTESFLQESGRAGRDGSTANSIVLVGTGDSLKAA